MQNITFYAAFLAGILSFFSPCVLPLALVYLSLITGFTVEDLYKKQNINKLFIFSRILAFVIGFSIVFLSLGIFAKYISFFLISNKKLLNTISGSILIFFGLNLLGILKFQFLAYEKKISLNLKNKGNIFVSFMLGIIFACGWTPCIGPILGSILAMASREESFRKSVLLLVIYSFGLSLPFILLGFFYNLLLENLKHFYKFLPVIQKIIGILIFTMGILIIYGKIF